jgi:hypothetical protein
MFVTISSLNVQTAGSLNQTQFVGLKHLKTFRSNPVVSNDIFSWRPHKESTIQPLDSTGKTAADMTRMRMNVRGFHSLCWGLTRDNCRSVTAADWQGITKAVEMSTAPRGNAREVNRREQSGKIVEEGRGVMSP